MIDGKRVPDRQRETLLLKHIIGRIVRLNHPKRATPFDSAWRVRHGDGGYAHLESIGPSKERSALAWPFLRAYIQEGYLVVE